MSFAGSTDDSAEDSSAEATVVRFDPPLPLLRAPVRSPAPSGEGPVLAFRDADSWRAAWEAAEASLVSQCEFYPSCQREQTTSWHLEFSGHWSGLAVLYNIGVGARSGCSISASRKCKPPWWKGLFVAAPTDYEERERCEEREMAACLEAAKEACIKFAKVKCFGPFRDARITSEGLLENTYYDVWGAAADRTTSTSSCAQNNQQSFSPDPGVTNYRGSDVLDSLPSKENNSSG